MLVARADPSRRTAERLDRLGVVVLLAGEAAELDRWLGRHEAALVRPDGTVAAAGTAEEALRPLPLTAPPVLARREGIR